MGTRVSLYMYDKRGTDGMKGALVQQVMMRLEELGAPKTASSVGHIGGPGLHPKRVVQDTKVRVLRSTKGSSARNPADLHLGHHAYIMCTSVRVSSTELKISWVPGTRAFCSGAFADDLHLGHHVYM